MIHRLGQKINTQLLSLCTLLFPLLLLPMDCSKELTEKESSKEEREREKYIAIDGRRDRKKREGTQETLLKTRGCLTRKTSLKEEATKRKEYM